MYYDKISDKVLFVKMMFYCNGSWCKYVCVCDFCAQGCRELHDPFGEQPEWSAFRSLEYGYMRLRIHNATHLYTEQVAVDKVRWLKESFLKKCVV